MSEGGFFPDEKPEEAQEQEEQEPLPEKLLGFEQNYVPISAFRGYCGGYIARADDGTIVFVKSFLKCSPTYRDAIYRNEEKFIPLLAKEGITPPLIDSGLFEQLIIQPFIEGKNLEDHITASDPPSPSETRKIATPIFAAAQKMHDKGVTHRDFKPANVIIRYVNDAPNYENPLIIDFGFSKREGEQDQLNPNVGTPTYQAPEQMDECDSDNRTDIYAAGIMLYEIITGELPFSLTNRFTIRQQKRRGPVKMQFEDKRISQAIEKATEPFPENRHQSFNEFIEAMKPRALWTTTSQKRTLFQRILRRVGL